MGFSSGFRRASWGLGNLQDPARISMTSYEGRGTRTKQARGCGRLGQTIVANSCWPPFCHQPGAAADLVRCAGVPGSMGNPAGRFDSKRRSRPAKRVRRRPTSWPFSLHRRPESASRRLPAHRLASSTRLQPQLAAPAFEFQPLLVHVTKPHVISLHVRVTLSVVGRPGGFFNFALHP